MSVEPINLIIHTAGDPADIHPHEVDAALPDYFLDVYRISVFHVEDVTKDETIHVDPASWTRWAEVVDYATARKVTVPEAIRELVNSGLSHQWPTTDPRGNLWPTGPNGEFEDHGVNFTIDYHKTDDTWTGIFEHTVTVVLDGILSSVDEPWTVEVTVGDGVHADVYTGTLGGWDGDGFTVTEAGELPRIIEIEDVRRIRA